MDQPIEPTKYSSQDPNMIKLKAYLMNTVAREFSQVAATPAEREEIVKEKLNKIYEQTRPQATRERANRAFS